MYNGIMGNNITASKRGPVSLTHLENTGLSRTDLRYLTLAARAADTQSRNSPIEQRHQLGAVAVRGGSLLAVGANKIRNIPSARVPRAAWSTHAEASCLRQISDPRGVTLYIARVTKQGKTRLARPCPLCWNMIYNMGVTKIVYTTNEGVAIEKILHPVAPNSEDYQPGLTEDEQKE